MLLRLIILYLYIVILHFDFSILIFIPPVPRQLPANLIIAKTSQFWYA